MEFADVVKGRRSVRRYKPASPVTDMQVQKLLETAISAPSAGNRQPWYFYVVRSQEAKQRLSDAAYGQNFIAEAPVVILICADPNRSASRYADRGERLYCIQDTAIAATYMMLAAVDMGFGTCWVGAFDEERAAAALDVPRHLRPVAILPVGYPADTPMGRTPRRPLSQVMTEVD